PSTVSVQPISSAATTGGGREKKATRSFLNSAHSRESGNPGFLNHGPHGPHRRSSSAAAEFVLATHPLPRRLYLGWQVAPASRARTDRRIAFVRVVRVVRGSNL